MDRQQRLKLLRLLQLYEKTGNTAGSQKIRSILEPAGQPAAQSIPSRPADLDPDISLRRSLGLPFDTGEFRGRTTGAPTEQAIARNQQNNLSGMLTSSPTLQASGSLIGGLLGSPGGPLGIAAGSTLGAMGGEALKGAIEQRPPVETAQDMATAGAWELGGYGVAKAIPVAYRYLKDKTIQKALGMTDDEAAEWISTAGRQGVPVGAVDITQKSWPRGFRTIFGRFPLLTTFPSAQKARTKALIEKRDELLDAIAPVATANAIGIDIAKNAGKTSSALKRYYGFLYRDADKLADRAGALVPTSGLKGTYKKLLDDKSLPELTSGSRMEDAGSADEVLGFIRQWDELPEYISAKEMRAIQKTINNLFDKERSGFGKHAWGEAKDATEKVFFDVANWDFSKLAPEVADTIVNRYQFANRIFLGSQKAIGASRRHPNPVADAILRTGDEGIKGGRLAGTVNPDELSVATMVFRARSPEAIRQLRTLAGDDVVKQLARSHINDAIEKATKQGTSGIAKRETIKIDPDTLMANLGLSERSKASADALAEMLRGTGTTVNDLKDFARVLATFDEVVLPSEFVARRAILGGLGSAARGVTGVGAILAMDPSRIVGLGLILGMRGGSSWLTNPQSLKYATKFLRRDPESKGYAQAALRMLRLATEQGTSKEEPKGVNVRQKLTSY